MSEHEGLNEGDDSPKQAYSCRFARHSWWGQVARDYILRVLFADAILPSSGATFSFFRFRIFALIGSAVLRSIVLRCACNRIANSHTQIVINCMCPLSIRRCRLFRVVLYTVTVSFCIESALHVFLPDGVVLSTLWTRRLDFLDTSF